MENKNRKWNWIQEKKMERPLSNGSNGGEGMQISRWFNLMAHKMAILILAKSQLAKFVQPNDHHYEVHLCVYGILVCVATKWSLNALACQPMESSLDISFPPNYFANIHWFDYLVAKSKKEKAKLWKFRWPQLIIIKKERENK